MSRSTLCRVDPFREHGEFRKLEASGAQDGSSCCAIVSLGSNLRLGVFSALLVQCGDLCGGEWWLGVVRGTLRQRNLVKTPAMARSDVIAEVWSAAILLVLCTRTHSTRDALVPPSCPSLSPPLPPPLLPRPIPSQPPSPGQSRTRPQRSYVPTTTVAKLRRLPSSLQMTTRGST